jgi:peptide deformylase
LCLEEKEGYKKPHGMSSANAGLAFNIIGITRKRNKKHEYCLIMINPKITWCDAVMLTTQSNCGSLTLKEPINVKRHYSVVVEYYTEEGVLCENLFTQHDGAFTIQHEIDHNKGILITDY